MRRRTLARVGLAWVVALAGLAGAPATARASVADAPAQLSPWPWPQICTEAGFTFTHARQSAEHLTLYLAGWIRPCPGQDGDQARYAFTLYFADRASPGRSSRPLLNPETRDYTFDVNGTFAEPVRAACVIDGMSVRLDGGLVTAAHRRACVVVDPVGTGLAVTPVPVTDPRVQDYLQLPPSWIPGTQEPVLPFCGSCL